jgi:class 3 adenylate cyclase
MSDEGTRRRRKLSAIMMADVSGFSRMMGENEERTVDLIKEFHQRVRQRVEESEGRVVDTAGDSVFGEFDSVVNAVQCARRIQEEQAEINSRRPPEDRIQTRIGVHLGDVIVEDYRVYGDGVNIAARLEPIADPGGICISEAVYQQVRDRIDVPVQDLGLQELKNIQYPVRVFKIPPASDPPAARSEPRDVATRRDRDAPAEPRAVVPPPEIPWSLELRKPSNLTLVFAGGVLLLSPLLLFPTGGVFPTGGAILVSIALGRVWARHAGRRAFLLALGAGIASGALFTNWSRITNVLFLLSGALVAAAGGQRRRVP